MIVATYSIAACDLDASQWGVAVQSKFLSVGSVVPWAEPEVGAVATQAYANPRYGPGGARAPARGAAGGGGRAAARRRRRGPGRAPARRRRRARRTPRPGPAPNCLDWAGPPHRALLLGAGEHPRRRRDGGRARGDVRGRRAPAARPAPARLPRGGAGGGRRPARPAVRLAPDRAARRRLRGPLRPRPRPAGRGPPRGRSRSCSASTRSTTGCSARRRARSGCRSRASSPTRCAGGWSGSATRASSRDALDRWAGVENLEERVDGGEEIDPVVLEALREALRVKTLRLDEVEGIPVFGTLVWKPVRKTLGVTAFGINAYTAADGRRRGGRGSHRGAARPRGDLRRRRRPRDVHGRRRGGGRAGRDARLPRRPGAAPLGGGEGAEHDRARDRRRAGPARDLRRGSTTSRRCRTCARATGTARAGCSTRRSPSTTSPSSTTSSRASRRRRATASARSSELNVAVAAAERFREHAADRRGPRVDPRRPALPQVTTCHLRRKRRRQRPSILK